MSQCIRIFLMAFLFALVQLMPNMGEAGNPRGDLFKRVLSRLAASSKSGVWRDDVAGAMRRALSEHEGFLTTDIMADVSRWLRSPEEALLGFVSRSGRGAARVGQEVEVGPMLRESLREGTGVDQLVPLFYEVKIGQLIEEVEAGLREIGPEALREFDDLLSLLRIYFPMREFPAPRATWPTRSIEDAGYQQALRSRGQAESVITGLRESGDVFESELAGLREYRPNAHSIIRNYQTALTKIQEMTQFVRRYSDGVLMSQAIPEADLYLAQIRMLDIEGKLLATHMLHGLAQREGRVLTRAELREILSQPSPYFREQAIGAILLQRGSLDSLSGTILEMEEALLVSSFPGEVIFNEGVEAIAILMQGEGNLEHSLGRLLVQTSTPLAEKKALIMALDAVSTDAALTILRESVSALSHDVKAVTYLLNRLISRFGESPEILEELRAVLDQLFREGNFEMKLECLKVFRQFPSGSSVMDDVASKLRATYGAADAVEQQLLVWQELVRGLPLHADFSVFQAAEILITAPGPVDMQAVAACFLLNHGNADQKALGLARLLGILWGDQIPSREVQRTIVWASLSHPTVEREVLPLMAKFVDVAQPDIVTVTILLRLTHAQDVVAARQLLQIFDLCLPNIKVEILQKLITSVSDREILHEVLYKIISFYKDSRYAFDLFDFVGESFIYVFTEHLRGDMTSLHILRRTLQESDLPLLLRRFCEQMIESLSAPR